jgi:hypothetical protein
MRVAIPKTPPPHREELIWQNEVPMVYQLNIRKYSKYKTGREFFSDTLFGTVRPAYNAGALLDPTTGWVANRVTFDLNPRHFEDLEEAKNFLESLYALEKA